MASFDISLDKLKALVRDRHTEGAAEIEALGRATGIAKSLKVTLNKGVSSSELKSRAETFGANFIPPTRLPTYFELLKDAFMDMTIIILTVAAVVSLILALSYEKTVTSYAEAIAILASIVVVTNVAAFNDWRKQKQFEKLNATVADVIVRGYRDGRLCDIHVHDIVVGDVLQLSVGDIMCADGILIGGDDVSTDESALTGEPRLIRKNVEKECMLLSGTKVMEGSGTWLVLAVGEHSEAGQIKKLIQGAEGKDDQKTKSDPDTSAAGADNKQIELKEVKDDKQADDTYTKGQSVLTAKLDIVVLLIGKLGLAISIMCFIIMCLRFAIQKFAITNSKQVCATISGKSCSDYSDYQDCSISPRTTQMCCQNADFPNEIELVGAPCVWISSHVNELIGFFITAVTILVVAVPEGLPLAVTLSLAFAVVKMQADNNLVKHLDACETMGSATTICSDKTGTLTKNRMTVARAYLTSCETTNETDSPTSDFASKPNKTADSKRPSISLARRSMSTLDNNKRSEALSIGKLDPAISEFIAESLSLNSTADIEWNDQLNMWDQKGNKTEGALLAFVKDTLSFDYRQIRQDPDWEKIKARPFSSELKRSCIVMKKLNNTSAQSKGDAVGSKGVYLFAKGASEVLLSLCSSELNPQGQVVPISQTRMHDLEEAIEQMASHAMRTICFAYKTVQDKDISKVSGEEMDSKYIDSDLCLLGIVGIEDPLRDEVPSAIKACHVAGVDVRMVTGDNIDTAIAIAKGCNILRSRDLDKNGKVLPNRAMTGPDFRKRVTDENGDIIQSKFDEIWPYLRVLARSSPTDKFILVSGLNASQLYKTDQQAKLGIYPDRQVVAVTGDGTNDAPALKRADVGFAMGIAGTQVAKDAADIILMDDNFSSIVKACKWGRNVYDAIAKFLQFQLTVNVTAITMAVIGSIAYSESPLMAVQMLWVNLIMDSLASLALATEPPNDDQLLRPPYGRNRSIVSPAMRWNIIGHSIYQLVVLIVLLFAGDKIFDIKNGAGLGHSAAPTEHYTLIFNTFVFMQLFNQINSRKLYHEWNPLSGLMENKLFIGIEIVEIVLQVILVQYGGSWFRTEPLDYKLWIASVVLGAISIPLQFLIVAIARMTTPLTVKPWLAENHPVTGDVVSAKPSAANLAASSLARISSKILTGVIGEIPSEEELRKTGSKPGFRRNLTREMRAADMYNSRK